jgi:hypothetical protein
MAIDKHLKRWGLAVLIVAIVVGLLMMMMKKSSYESDSSSLGSGEWTVYGSNNCGWTRKQLENLDEKHISYSFIDCDKEDCGGVTAFPTLKNDDGTVKVGYTPM